MGVRGETIGTAYVVILADGTAFADDVKKVVKQHAGDLEKAGGDAGGHFGKGFDKETDRNFSKSLRGFESKVDKVAQRFRQRGDKIGKIFGKGARNDLLNFFGSFMSLAPRASAAVTGLLGSLVGLAAKLTELGEGGGIGAVIGGLAKITLPGLAVAAATVLVLAQSLGILASAAVLTSGLVLALAGSIGFALAGAISVATLALVPFAAALGVAALAMGEVDKKSKPFKALKKDWKDLRKETAKALFGKDGSGFTALQGVLKTVRPLILGVAKSMNGLLESFAKQTKTKDFRDLMADIGDILPGMVKQLGTIGGNLLLGVGRAFVAAEPMITEFLGWLEGVSKKLAEAGLVPGAKPGGKGGGQSPLGTFFEDAWKSAKKVGGLIKEIVLAIGDLFGAGKWTGDNIFVLLTEQVKKFRDWLARAKKDGSLQKMFDDAELLAMKVGDIITKVGELITKLDTPENRTILFALLGVTEKLLDFLILIAGEVEKLQGTDWGAWGKKIGDSFDGAEQRPKEAWAKIKEIFAPVGSFFSSLGSLIKRHWISGFDGWEQRPQEAWTKIKGLFADAGSFFSSLGTEIKTGLSNAFAGSDQRPREAANKIKGVFAKLPGQITTTLGNLGSRFAAWVAPLPGRARAVVAKIPPAFSGLANKIIKSAGSAASKFATWVSSLPGKARSTASSISSAFSNTSGKIISKAGSISSKFSSWVSSLPGKAKTVANRVADAFSGLAAKAFAKAGSLTARMSSWASGVYGRARGVANSIVSAFSGLAGRIIDAIGTIVPRIRMPSIPRPTVTAIVKGAAAGGVFNSPEIRLFGEAGPEAIVPLRRSLAQVDPSVRALSAFAQGLTPPNGKGGGGGKSIDVGGITIHTPTENPRAVAAEVIARMTAASYI